MKPIHHMILAGVALSAAFASSTASAADDNVVRLGNLKFAHYGAVSYIKEIAPRCRIRVEEHMFAKGPDVMQAILAGELDVGATASEAAISVKDLKGKKVGVTRGGIHEVLLNAELAQAGLTVSDSPGKDVQLIYLAFADLNLPRRDREHADGAAGQTAAGAAGAAAGAPGRQ